MTDQKCGIGNTGALEIAYFRDTQGDLQGVLMCKDVYHGLSYVQPKVLKRQHFPSRTVFKWWNGMPYTFAQMKA